MFKFFSFLFPIIISTSFSYGQHRKKKEYKPFKITIIVPDTVKLDNTLRQFSDTIPKAHLDTTFAGQIWERTDYDPKSGLTLAEYETKEKKESDEAFELEKAEAGINHFKPRELIAQIISERLNEWFNRNLSDPYWPEESDSLHWIAHTKIIEDKSIKSIKRLQRIADSLASDYVIFFKNISTAEVKKPDFDIKITTVLYSGKERVILYQKQTISGIDKLAWYDINPLHRLLEYGVDPAGELYKIIERKQRK